MIINGFNSYITLQQQAVTATTTQKDANDFKTIFENALESQDSTKLKEACNQLESYMLSMVFKQVKESMLQDDEDALIPQGDYTRTFSDSMINTFSDSLVEAGGIGLADQLYRQMSQIYNLDKLNVIKAEKVTEASEATQKVELDKML